MYADRDDEVRGQMSFNDLYEPPERTFAISRVFARAHKNMSLNEQKTLVYALTQIDFTKSIEKQDNLIKLDKKMLAAAFGFKEGYDINHLSADLYEEIKLLPEHSGIEIADKDKGLYSNGFVVASVSRFKNHFRIELSRTYLSLFMGLEKDYLTMWSIDIFRMMNKRSVQFYEFLREITDTRKDVNVCELGVKKLKEMFDIPKEGKGSYMRPADKGGFNRQMFEQRVIDPLCEDLKKSKMITLIVQSDGKCYEKIKQGNRVVGYRFAWLFTARPGVASAEETHELKEQIDKDPKLLKVAKNIVDGKKKPKKKPKDTGFVESCNDDGYLEKNGFSSWDELEKKLISN